MAVLTEEQVVTVPGLRPEPITPIKLSQAMRLGAMTTEQMFGRPWNEDQSKACAIGAAYLGLGAPDGIVSSYSYDYVSRFGNGKSYRTPCLHDYAGNTLTGVIWHLNDDHKWPREKIAEWLEGLGL